MTLSPSVVGEAWASRRESDDGRTADELFDLARVGKRCEFGGCVTINVSSTSGSGGPGGSDDGLSLEGLMTPGSFAPWLSVVIFLADNLLLLLLGCCVQSSTSSM